MITITQIYIIISKHAQLFYKIILSTEANNLSSINIKGISKEGISIYIAKNIQYIK